MQSAAAPNAPVRVVCFKDGPAYNQQNSSEGGKPNQQCWYNRPADTANRNLYLVPINSPAQGQVAPNAKMMVVCGTNDPGNYTQNIGWGGETTPRCWYGRPATVQVPYAQPVPPPVNTQSVPPPMP